MYDLEHQIWAFWKGNLNTNSNFARQLYAGQIAILRKDAVVCELFLGKGENSTM